MDKKRVNIYVIANEADVSPATVSRVINMSASVSKEKRERVWKVIQKYNFIPNALAKGLSSTKSKMLGALLSNADSPFYSKLIVECEKAAIAKGYTFLTFSSFFDNELEKKQLEKMYELCVDAIIILGCFMDSNVIDEERLSMLNYLTEEIPVVVMGRSQGIPCYELRLDEAGAMEQAMEYLIKLGHTKIAFLGGAENAYSAFEKRLTYRRILKKYGIEMREDWMKYGDFSSDSGYHMMEDILKSGDLPTAVIGINDFVSGGIINAVQDAGLKVPEDISIITFDDTYISEIVRPAFTCMACDYKELADCLVGTAIAAAEGKDAEQQQVVKME